MALLVFRKRKICLTWALELGPTKEITYAIKPGTYAHWLGTPRTSELKPIHDWTWQTTTFFSDRTFAIWHSTAVSYRALNKWDHNVIQAGPR